MAPNTRICSMVNLALGAFSMHCVTILRRPQGLSRVAPSQATRTMVLLVMLLTSGFAAANSDQVLGEHTLELSSPKFKMKVLRQILPRGFKATEHIHDLPGPRYVIKGRVRVLSEGVVAEYGPGELFWEMPGTFMMENISAGEVDLLMVETVPEAPPPKPPAPPVSRKKTRP